MSNMTPETLTFATAQFARSNDDLGRAIRAEQRRLEALGRDFTAEDAAQLGRDNRALAKSFRDSVTFMAEQQREALRRHPRSA